MTHLYVWHDSFVCVTWLIRMCDMTHSYVWHDSFICVTWLIRMCDMTHSYVWHDSFIRVTWLIRMCDMTHSYVWHDWFVYDMTQVPTYYYSNYILERYGHFSMIYGAQGLTLFMWVIYFPWLICICAVTHSYICAMPHVYMCHDSFIHMTRPLFHDLRRTRARSFHVSHICAVTHTCICHIFVPWLIYLRDKAVFSWAVTHSCICRSAIVPASFIYMT